MGIRINPDDYCVLLDGEFHLRNVHAGCPGGGAWNNAWTAWLDGLNGRTLSENEVLKSMHKTARRFGLE